MTDQPASMPLVVLARQAQQARQRCAEHFPKGLLRDSAWDIMLELFIHEELHQDLCVKDVMIISGESAAGTIRRLERLEEAGLTSRCHDIRDHRRVLVKLDARGRAAMMAFLHHLFDMGAATPSAPKSFHPDPGRP